MNNRVCEMVGCEFPLFAFSHCRDVVAAVSRAGGFGVLGGSGFTPEQLETELAWIDAHVDGKPYGVDILVPEHLAIDPDMVNSEKLKEQISPAHRKFTAELLAKYGIQVDPDDLLSGKALTLAHSNGEALMDVAFRHPIRLIANALGIAPPSMIERGRKYGVPVAALVGAKEHALRQVKAGVDIIVAQGTEAGGHCGEVSTLVLVPEVVRALKGVSDVPVLAAGGIVTGRQMAACMALGAAGAWTGTVWLATMEAETSEAFREKMVAATSRDTIRSVARTGKPSRQLRSAWHDAWEGKDSPGALPMPQMGLVSQPAFERIERSVAGGNTAARPLVSYFVGQGVGLIDNVTSAAAVVADFRQEFVDAMIDLQEFVE
ncbi:NAD(P)H-dependent flavin oxidoreductase [Paraburkholderia phytofirmans]|uniref:NAD(P)H-dependent flavin oxidoreductase n=1 Tax=Paraburkholderia phytofirmans TaxID=261302 RepID=UPI0038B7AACC